MSVKSATRTIFQRVFLIKKSLYFSAINPCRRVLYCQHRHERTFCVLGQSFDSLFHDSPGQHFSFLSSSFASSELSDYRYFGAGMVSLRRKIEVFVCQIRTWYYFKNFPSRSSGKSIGIFLSDLPSLSGIDEIGLVAAKITFPCYWYRYSC